MVRRGFENLSNQDLLDLIREAKRRGLMGAQGSPWKIGQALMIETVTWFWLGELVDIGSDYYLLDGPNGAVRVADEGRTWPVWEKGLSSEHSSSVEPTGAQREVKIAAVVSIGPWPHDIPSEQI